MENVDGEKHKLLTIIYKWKDANISDCMAVEKLFAYDWFLLDILEALDILEL